MNAEKAAGEVLAAKQAPHRPGFYLFPAYVPGRELLHQIGNLHIPQFRALPNTILRASIRNTVVDATETRKRIVSYNLINLI